MVCWILKKVILLKLKTNKMFKKLGSKIAQLIAPIVINELIILVEELIKIDINKDGKIGR